MAAAAPSLSSLHTTSTKQEPLSAPSTPSSTHSEGTGMIYDVDEGNLNGAYSDQTADMDGKTPHASPPASLFKPLAPLESADSPTSSKIPSSHTSTPATSPETTAPGVESLPPGADPAHPPNGLPTDLFDTPSSSSPIFPSPSSSFRPPPESESDLTSRLDSRIAAEKGKKVAEPESSSGDTGREGRLSHPVQPPSRPPSRPASSQRGRPGSGLADRKASFPRHEDWTPRMSSHSSTYLAEIMVIVRDFAFESSDPRFKGEPHPDALLRSGRTSSRASRDDLSDSPALGNEAFASSGSSGFSWGFVTSHQTDFASEDDSQVYSEEEYAQDDPLGEFVPGIYVAMYDFEPEAETEMGIRAGESVQVLSRQCAGWVQAARLDETADLEDAKLVPENYLMFKEPFTENSHGHTQVSQTQVPLSDAVFEAPDDSSEADDGQKADTEEEYGDEVSTPRPIVEEPESTKPDFET